MIEDPYPALPDDERTERAREARMPHRYRGGRLMLVDPASDASAIGVVRVIGLDTDEDGLVLYRVCRIDDSEPMHLPEWLLVEPDPEALEAAMASCGPAGSVISHADLHRLRRSYVWIAFDGEADGNPDALVFECLRNPVAMWGGPPEPDDAMVAWSDRGRLRRAKAATPHWTARVPIVAAARLANGRSLVINLDDAPTITLHPLTVDALARFA